MFIESKYFFRSNDHGLFQQLTKQAGAVSTQQDLQPRWRHAPTDAKKFPFLKRNELLMPLPGENNPLTTFVCCSTHLGEEIF